MSKVESYLFPFSFRIPAAIILAISITSFNSLSALFLSLFPESLNRPNQYLASLALFRAISWNFLNSRFELAAVASTKLAPMLVPHLKS